MRAEMIGIEGGEALREIEQLAGAHVWVRGPCAWELPGQERGIGVLRVSEHQIGFKRVVIALLLVGVRQSVGAGLR